MRELEGMANVMALTTEDFDAPPAVINAVAAVAETKLLGWLNQLVFMTDDGLAGPQRQGLEALVALARCLKAPGTNDVRRVSESTGDRYPYVVANLSDTLGRSHEVAGVGARALREAGVSIVERDAYATEMARAPDVEARVAILRRWVSVV